VSFAIPRGTKLPLTETKDAATTRASMTAPGFWFMNDKQRASSSYDATTKAARYDGGWSGHGAVSCSRQARGDVRRFRAVSRTRRGRRRMSAPRKLVLRASSISTTVTSPRSATIPFPTSGSHVWTSR